MAKLKGLCCSGRIGSWVCVEQQRSGTKPWGPALLWGSRQHTWRMALLSQQHSEQRAGATTPPWDSRIPMMSPGGRRLTHRRRKYRERIHEFSSQCQNGNSHFPHGTRILHGLQVSVQFSRLVVSNSLWLHGLQHARPPCPSPTPGVYSNSCPVSRWWHPTISSSVIPFSSCLQTFPALGSFPNESVLCIRWPKYWSFCFNISPFNEYSGLISFRMDWLDLLAGLTP